MSDIAPLRAGDPTGVGDYELIGRIGEGGQGSVFLATSPSGEKVAVKLLRQGLVDGTEGAAAPGRFLRETEILRRVAPFCTAQVIATGTLGDRPYIVSEYIEGPTLQQVVQSEGRLVNARLRRLAVGTMTALTAIHRAGVVHRDFKPSNVLLGRDGPRVIDFGIARALDSSATGSGIVGTPPYMAPEQLDAHPVEPPSDLFAWGSTMVFAATGRPPFGMDSLPAVVNRILHKEPELGDLDGDLRELVAQCLSKDPSRRPTARDALLRLLGAGERSPSGDLLTAGTAAASASPQAFPSPSARPPGGPAASFPPQASAGRTPLPFPGDTAPRPFTITTVPGDATGTRRRRVWIAAGAAVLALVSGGVVYAVARSGGSGSPGPGTPTPRALAEVTSAPASTTREVNPPGIKTVLHESGADPIRVTSFVYVTAKESQSYARDPKTGEFESIGPYQEPVVSPDGAWTAVLPWLKQSIPQPYDIVRLVRRSNGQEYAVRLADKPLQDFYPFWSDDSRRLLLTAFEVAPSGDRTSKGFAVVDAATGQAKVVHVETPGAAGFPFVWVPGRSAVAQRYKSGAQSGLRFYDLDGKVIRTLPDVGDPILLESPFSPAGKRFVTICPDAVQSVCVWDIGTGRRQATVPLPAKWSVGGWYNDAYLVATDPTKDPHRVVVMDLKGRVVRPLAEIPVNETNGEPGRLQLHYTHR
ncbi:serine/threonine-protein kinase [Sphaerisporangium fuscum]|uniref:serine/threonine-protein kinase n=1 Tax=Sphaerisporangium fuscum TaxID=2835868 RepID=UPI001BDCDCF7|nr:serine/threonine-protein kinase [Sphaerisporangium fuscum]